MVFDTVSLIASFLQMKPLITAFATGMADIIDPKWLGLFNAKEFNQVRLPFLQVHQHPITEFQNFAAVIKMLDKAYLSICPSKVVF